MKKLFLLFIAVMILGSCSQLYTFVQVFEAKPTYTSDAFTKTEHGYEFENANCIINYNFWGEEGYAGFMVSNKTTEIMYIDLSKSFFIRNGKAFDYYKNRIFENDSSEKVVEKPFVAIPPSSSKIISEYTIFKCLVLNCELNRFPEEQDSILYDIWDTPLQFSNYITYKVGDNGEEVTIQNHFYISKITNYAEPYLYRFVEKQKPCQNMTDETSKDYKEKYPIKVYDKLYNIETANCFYINYSVYSKRRLYKGRMAFLYDERYDGYIKMGSDERSDYLQKLIDPLAKPEE